MKNKKENKPRLDDASAVQLLTAFPVLGRCDIRDFPEDPVKMRQVGKTGLPGNFGDIPVRFHEEPLGIHDAGLPDIFHDRALGTFLEFPAEIIFTDVKTLGEIFERDIFCVMVVDILNYFGNPGLAEDAGALLIHAQKLHHNQVQKRLHTFVVAVQMRMLLLFHGIDDTPQLVDLLTVRTVNHLRVEKLMKKIRRGDRFRAEIQHHPRKCHILVAVGTVHRLRWEENTVPGLKLEELVVHQMIALSAVEKIQLKIIVIVRLRHIVIDAGYLGDGAGCTGCHTCLCNINHKAPHRK